MAFSFPTTHCKPLVTWFLIVQLLLAAARSKLYLSDVQVG